MSVKPCLLMPMAAMLIVACTTQGPQPERVSRQYPEQAPTAPARSPASIQSHQVPAHLTTPPIRFGVSSKARPTQLRVLDGPRTKRKKSRFISGPALPQDKPPAVKATPTPKGLSTSFDSIDFDDNETTTQMGNQDGAYFIPADPHGAAGPNHLVAVTNASIQFHPRANPSSTSPESLFDFFEDLNPQTFTFDPRVLYDRFEDRWLVLTLERTDTTDGAPANTSRIFLAVSDDADPNGFWTVTAIDAKEAIASAVGSSGCSTVSLPSGDHWADFPSLAVDEEAVYITANMFRFFDDTVAAGAFGGSRLWIVEKGVNNGFYDDRNADVTRFNPFTPPNACPGTHHPALINAPAPSGDVGTYLVMFDGLQDGNDETVQIIEVEDPLGTTQFNVEYLSLGNVDDLSGPLLDMPQDGPSIVDDFPIEANDRRVLDAVWRDQQLYFTTTIEPRTGAGRDETTALWAQVDVSNFANIDLVQSGVIDADDLGNETFTGFAALAVNAGGIITIGYTASNDRIHPGAYYAVHVPGDADGSTRGSQPLRVGQDHYIRAFGGPENRWGDYSAVVLDPVDSACFWAYNKYAMDTGTTLPDLPPEEDGRWATAFGQVCANRPPTALNDALPDSAEDSVRMIPGNTLLANDDSGDSGQVLSVVSVSNAVGGSVSLQGNTITFNPTPDYFGAAGFDYLMQDNGTTGGTLDSLQAGASASFTITPVNDPSRLTDDVLNSVSENSPTIVIPVTVLLANDQPGPVNEASENLSVTAVSGAIGGSVVLNGNQVEFTLNPGFDGVARFIYSATDDNTQQPETANANVSFSVTGTNDPPVTGIESVTAYRGQNTVILDSAAVSLLQNDSDPELTTLTAAVAVGPADASLIVAPGGTFIYAHNGSAAPSDSFTYEVCDSGVVPACSQSAVAVSVIPAPFATCAPGGVRAVAGVPWGVATAPLFDPTQTTYTLSGHPPGVQIDSASGVIFGTPGGGDVGTHNLTITASGAAAAQMLSLRLTVDMTTDSLFFSGLESDCISL